MQWQDSYNVGVTIIDEAHKKLFSIVRKLMEVTKEKDPGKSRRISIEGIKYFKNYTVEHFAQEEEYMRSIGYSGYPIHKRIHDKMREETIPSLEHMLEKADYSRDAVATFLGTCIGWLTGHIMIEDQAITGKIDSRVQRREETEDHISQIGNVISEVTEEIFEEKAQLASRYYSGGEMKKPLCCRMRYRAEDGSAKDLLMAFEETFVFHAVGRMSGIPFREINPMVLSAMEELIRMMGRRIAFHFGETAYIAQTAQFDLLEMEEMKNLYAEQPPEYSLLMETARGKFSLGL